MKALILAVFFLLGVAFTSPAFAAGQKEPTYPPYCWLQPQDSELWYPCGSEEIKLAQCNHLMDTAMHKVDPYLQFLDRGSDISKLLPKEKEDFDKSLYAWERIKHECWKEFEEERMRPEHIH